VTGRVVAMWKNDTASSVTVVADGLCVITDRPVECTSHSQCSMETTSQVTDKIS